LVTALSASLQSISKELCVTHSTEAAEALLEEVAVDSNRCAQGLVHLAAAPKTLGKVAHLPVLTIQGTKDGIVRFSDFAAARHISTSPKHRFAVVPGASHHSFVEGQRSAPLAALDLKPDITNDQAVNKAAAVIADFLGHTNTGALAEAEALAAKMAQPVIDALQLEGSTKLGHPACNSDFPTNPTCQYPKWPDHSLGFPAPAPSPPLPSDCICGSPWVVQHASLVYGLGESKQPQFTATVKDSFQDVSDVTPFHLPHIFNSCDKSATSCDLNTTTLTMPVYKAGDLFPNASSQPLSAIELRSKLKSRTAVWEAAGLDAPSSVDSNLTFCKDINQLAYDWALQHAESSVRAQFEAHGEPFVIVDDKVATIGITGPEWIKDELVFERVKTETGSHIEVQSWQFVVGNTNGGHVPWFYPVGMHYCKLLSPARAMEWIYTDGLRSRLSA